MYTRILSYSNAKVVKTKWHEFDGFSENERFSVHK